MYEQKLPYKKLNRKRYMIHVGDQYKIIYGSGHYYGLDDVRRHGTVEVIESDWKYKTMQGRFYENFMFVKLTTEYNHTV
jgi:hypothetical protein